jgi:hypothetical protein
MAGMALRRLPTTRLAAIEGPAVSLEDLQSELRLLQQRKAAAAVAQEQQQAMAAAAAAVAATATHQPTADQAAAAGTEGGEGEAEGLGPGWRTPEEIQVRMDAGRGRVCGTLGCALGLQRRNLRLR